MPICRGLTVAHASADGRAVSDQGANHQLALENPAANGEIQPEATIRKFLIVRQEGTSRVSRNIDYYNLDAILAVGYRVRSTRGTQFRNWASMQQEAR